MASSSPSAISRKTTVPPFQVVQQLLTEVMILRRPLPEAQHAFLARPINPEGHHEGVPAPMNGIEKYGKGGEVL